VSAFRIDAATGKLMLLNQVSAMGEDPCYISLDRTARWALVANYTSGNVVVFPIGDDGKLGFASANVHDEGLLGPNKARQEAPHAHWVKTSGDNRMAYVADLGLDRIIPYDFDAKEGTLALKTQMLSETMAGSHSVAVSPGTGPRHAVFSADGNVLYALGELKSTVTVVNTTRPLGIFAQGQEISTLPAKFTGRNDAAEIAIDASGEHLYASNRGHESVAVFSIDKKSGMLNKVDDTPTGGKEPRHFALDPGGNFLLAEHQLSGNIVEFRVDTASGKLTPSGATVTVPSPVCLVFVALK